MQLSVWQALNPFNKTDYVLTQEQRLVEFWCVAALLLLFAALLTLALIKIIKRKNGDKK